jgi:hypothetical protein
MSRLFDRLILVSALFILVLGYFIVKRNYRTKEYLREPGGVEKYQIEAIKISNVQGTAPELKEICYFETQKDIDNWTSYDSTLKLSNRYVTQGRSSMEIISPAEDSIKLFYSHFPRDWQHYGKIVFDLYSNAQGTTKMQIRIDDNYDINEFHGPRDRAFFEQKAIRTGWNKIEVRIDDLRKRINVASERKIVRLYFDPHQGSYYIDNMKVVK